jgi:hypothetical protein
VIEKLKNVIAKFGIAIKNLKKLNNGKKSRGINSIIKFPILGGIRIFLKDSIGLDKIFIIISVDVSPHSFHKTAAICI